MKKLLWLPVLLLFGGSSLLAQTPNRTTLRGIAVDTAGAELVGATVMLLSPKDTTLLNFTRTNDKGAFSFKNIKNQPYLLKISYVSFLPFQQHVPASTTEEQDLGRLKIKPISQELMEVVIRTAKAPLRIHGDTIEYDASTFKVPPGSTVEDLLRRLPGIEVDADGNIKAQGKNVQKVYVDGKTFFGDDPKAATKNLGAETISKVQVYNEKSEQAKLTGIDDGVKDKAMNLELKEEYKKGSFGKLTGAVGTEERWAGRGSYNRFNEKQQLSFIGYANNINQTGVNWEDYGEFKGQSTFSNFDNGDFGFGGRRYFIIGGDDGVMNYFDGRGFTKNFGAGTNYNYDHKKSKFNASYFYNQVALTLDQQSLRQTFLPEGSFFNTDTTSKKDFRGNHSISTRYESDLDSNDVLVLKASARIGNTHSDTRDNQRFYQADSLTTNTLNVSNAARATSWRLSSSAIFRHRFKKKGRSVAVSAGYNGSRNDGTENVFSLNRFFQASDFTAQVRQLNATTNDASQWKSSALYTEPLTKKWFLETFYNFALTDTKANRQVTDLDRANLRLDSLSLYYDNIVRYNRLGSSLRYSYKGLNVMTGLAAQQLQLEGQYAPDKGQPPLIAPIRRTFTNWMPYLDANYESANHVNVSASYGYTINEPSFEDLQPVPNVTNPAFRTEGNPNLGPERSHSLSAYVGYWNPANFSNVGVSSDATFYDEQIVYNQTIEVVDSLGIRTTTRPENVSGGQHFGAHLWSNFPLIKTKLTLSVNGGVETGKTPSFVNGEENETRNDGFNVGVGLNATPSQKLILGIDADLRINHITYSIQQDQNQNILNQGLNASAKWQFLSKTFLETNFDYNFYRNDHFGLDQNVPLWNASVRRLLGANNRIELRLAAFDLLNRNLSIRQSGTQNYLIQNVATTLSRYVMLSVSYNVRGYEDKLKKNDWW